MAGMGAPEMLAMLLFIGGLTGIDSVAIIDPVQYFTARQVDVSIDKMAGLAAAAPKDAKGQVMQLLALRYLADNADKLKKADRYAAHRKLLEQIAAGKEAQDPQGFAKEYAAAVLDRLDGKTRAVPAPAPAVPKIQEAFAWFPAEAKVVVAADIRAARDERGGVAPSAMIAGLQKRIPEKAWGQVFDVMDKLGNIRLQRIAFAYVGDKNPDKTKIYVRYTGKANPAWVRSAIRSLEPGFEERDIKDPATGRSLTMLRRPDHAPIMMFVGDTEMIMVGYENDRKPHEGLAEEMLAVRAGKQRSVLAGPLKARLKKVPARAFACVVGDLPDSMRKELGSMPLGGMPLGGSVPLGVDAYVEKVPAGYDASATATMANAANAQTAVMAIAKLRQQGINALQQQLKQPNANPRLPVNALINLMQSLQMQSEGAELRLRLLVPRDILQGLPQWFMPN